MQFKYFNSVNTPSTRRHNGVFRILFTGSGRISLSKSLASTLGGGELLPLQFVQDELRPVDWYLTPIDQEQSYRFRPDGENGCKGYYLQHAEMCRIVRRSLGVADTDKSSVSINVSCTPVEVQGKLFYALLTRQYLDKNDATH
jgi:hypothetical protein